MRRAGYLQHQQDDHPQHATTSPCVRMCCLDDRDICLGCFRSLDEIREWHQATDGRRRLIVEQAQRRRQLRDSNCFDNLWQLNSKPLE